MNSIGIASEAQRLFYAEEERQRKANSRVPDDGDRRHEFWRFEDDTVGQAEAKKLELEGENK